MNNSRNWQIVIVLLLTAAGIIRLDSCAPPDDGTSKLAQASPRTPKPLKKQVQLAGIAIENLPKIARGKMQWMVITTARNEYDLPKPDRKYATVYGGREFIVLAFTPTPWPLPNTPLAGTLSGGALQGGLCEYIYDTLPGFTREVAVGPGCISIYGEVDEGYLFEFLYKWDGRYFAGSQISGRLADYELSKVK